MNLPTCQQKVTYWKDGANVPVGGLGQRGRCVGYPAWSRISGTVSVASPRTPLGKRKPGNSRTGDSNLCLFGKHKSKKGLG